ncbi:MAG TPA: hypothetical protein VHA82_09040 [Ramlibacter sp.]|uniref:hypothetical protein n=1 Tax=Ramlibacter sp. TaxID=1917967 RepID=UPI002D088779|nr:hypothetical protein [Ramlibacter sp.]HVZ43942.1 hypothetical protein [Ramlibacter sp.]
MQSAKTSHRLPSADSPEDRDAQMRRDHKRANPGDDTRGMSATQMVPRAAGSDATLRMAEGSYTTVFDGFDEHEQVYAKYKALADEASRLDSAPWWDRAAAAAHKRVSSQLHDTARQLDAIEQALRPAVRADIQRMRPRVPVTSRDGSTGTRSAAAKPGNDGPDSHYGKFVSPRPSRLRHEISDAFKRNGIPERSWLARAQKLIDGFSDSQPCGKSFFDAIDKHEDLYKEYGVLMPEREALHAQLKRLEQSRGSSASSAEWADLQSRLAILSVRLKSINGEMDEIEGRWKIEISEMLRFIRPRQNGAPSAVMPAPTDPHRDAVAQASWSDECASHPESVHTVQEAPALPAVPSMKSAPEEDRQQGAAPEAHAPKQPGKSAAAVRAEGRDIVVIHHCKDHPKGRVIRGG